METHKKAVELIASHLDASNLKIKIHEDIDTICGFTGVPIRTGVLLKDLIKKTFTDYAYIRYNSEYASVDVAMCIDSTYQTYNECVFSGGTIGVGVSVKSLIKKYGKDKVVSLVGKEDGYLATQIAHRFFEECKEVCFLNALRNYSFLATKRELRILSREDILQVIMDAPKEPFVLCVTYSNKKHIAFKATVNYNSTVFNIYTDLGVVTIDLEVVQKIYAVVKNWYCILEGKENSGVAPTCFTKKDILHGCKEYKKIKAYGIDRYNKENEFLRQYRNTAMLRLLVHVLNKTTKND